MKKRLLITVAFAGCISLVFAQTLRKPANSAKSVHAMKELLRENVTPLTQEKAKAAEFSVVSKSDFNEVSVLRSAAATLAAKYQRPEGTMYVGYNSDLTNYVPLIVGKSNTNWTFRNKSEGATSYEWKINGSSEGLTVANNGNMTYNPASIGMYYMPEITARNASASESWYYGQNKGQYRYLIASMDIWPLTNAERHYGGLYSGFEDGYGFGTEETKPGENTTGILTYYEKPQAPLCIQEIGSIIYSNSDNPLSANGKLIMTVYTLNNDGSLNEAVISSELYREDLISFGSDPVWYTPFRFIEYDPQTGLESEIELLIDYAFAVELTWEDANADFGVFMSVNTYDAGSAYVTTDQDQHYKYGRWNEDRTVFYNMYDVMFTLVGTYPTFEVFEPTQKVTVPIVGGDAIFNYEGQNYSSIVIESSFDGEVIQIKAIPEWLNLTRIEEVWDEDPETGENYYTNVIYVYLSGEALPSNMTGRSGNVVLSNHGVTATIQVKQGDADWITGISATTPAIESAKAVRQGDNFILSYPASATSVSVYNVTGQRIGEYKLNATGKYTLPAANLAKGIYVLKFNGVNPAVKIIK
jgi:hypothetical protein